MLLDIYDYKFAYVESNVLVVISTPNSVPVLIFAEA
jgi:hypothetical protein